VSRALESTPARWLWLADAASDEQAQRAVALGAYDAVTSASSSRGCKSCSCRWCPPPLRRVRGEERAARKLLGAPSRRPRALYDAGALTGETGTGKELAGPHDSPVERPREAHLRADQLRRDNPTADGGRAVRLVKAPSRAQCATTTAAAGRGRRHRVPRRDRRHALTHCR